MTSYVDVENLIDYVKRYFLECLSQILFSTFTS